MEFAVISRYFTRSSQRGDVILGVGDDCALLRVPDGRELAVTVDTLVASVHFPSDTAPEAIGWKALAVSLSDLAAMGAEPAWATLALTMPQIEENWLMSFSKGLFQLADYYHVALIGGDTTCGPLSITIQAHGFIPMGQALRRSGAQCGDLIYVTGSLGDAAVGLDLYQNSFPHPISSADSAYLCGRLDRPQPRVGAGLALRGLATAAIDISDGLAGDLMHILDASQVGATVELEHIPRSSVLGQYPVSWEKILSGGDDYELCFTLPIEKVKLLERIGGNMECNFTPIGVIRAAKGITWLNGEGKEVSILSHGYQHFSTAH